MTKRSGLVAWAPPPWLQSCSSGCWPPPAVKTGMPDNACDARLLASDHFIEIHAGHVSLPWQSPPLRSRDILGLERELPRTRRQQIASIPNCVDSRCTPSSWLMKPWTDRFSAPFESSSSYSLNSLNGRGSQGGLLISLERAAGQSKEPKKASSLSSSSCCGLKSFELYPALGQTSRWVGGHNS